VTTQPLLWSEFTTIDFSVEKNSNVSFVFSDASSEKMVDRDRCPGHSPQEISIAQAQVVIASRRE
jgi:hypothetical protein